MGLEKYQEKRDLQRTPEPPPEVKAGKGPLTFVVQKHRARQLHYDLRLELDGVLKSWSVPKGPSLDPGEKRLAVMVEDHPLEYASFEGAIPKGEYGAGEVIVWESGTYSPDEGGELLFSDRAAAENKMRLGIENGKLSFFLRGSKLKGSWTLVKIKNKQNDWLLMKHRDEYARTGSNILEEEQSVASGRTIEDIKEQRNPDTKSMQLNPGLIPGARPAPFPSSLAPMLASLAEGPFSRPGWIFEPKLDGYRTIALIREGKVTLLSRRGNKVTASYNMLVPDLSRQPTSELILDGEIIAMDEKGKVCFQCLQNYLKSVGRKDGAPDSRYQLIYYVFDILYLDGYDLRGAALLSRKKLLQSIFHSTDQLRLVEYFDKDGETVYKAAVENGLEGVIAKEIDSLYESGKRSLDWLKMKATQSDEFVISGYSQTGKRSNTFSSLLLGYYNDKGKLMFAGHVGSGFDEKALKELKQQLDALSVERSPFSDPPPLNAPTTWVRPELVAEVKFAERTNDGRLRAPVFLRLREDKSPDEIRRMETVAAANKPPVKIKRNSRVKEPAPQAASGKNDAVTAQLQNPENDFNIEVEGHKISLTNMDKLLWPSATGLPGFTKRDFLKYLAEVSPYILPHLKDRPLTLSRYPNGINGEHFYQKHWGHPVPEFVRKIDITEEKGSKSEYLICDNLASLIWLGQVANIELHSWFSRVSAAPDMPEGKSTDYLLDYPDFIIFDLDPYIYSGKETPGAEPELNRAGFDAVCDIALRLKNTLDELELNAFVKTSGKTGLHIHVPIIRRFDYKSVRSTAEIIGKFLVRKYPREITTEWAQEKRKGKIFVDYGQNVRGKTLASIYSPRPVRGAPVSTPLRWEELGKVYPTDLTLMTVPTRLIKTGDLWEGILSAKKDLDKLPELK